jgi:hypothetical protein
VHEAELKHRIERVLVWFDVGRSRIVYPALIIAMIVLCMLSW